MFERILVSLLVDDELNEPLVRAALKLADTHDAEIRVLTLVPAAPAARAGGLTAASSGLAAAAPTIADLRAAARAYQQQLRTRLLPAEMAGYRIEHEFREGRVDAEVVDAAVGWNADLIVLGAQQRGFLDRLFQGRAHSEAIVRSAPCAVIAIPAAALGEPLSDALEPIHARRSADLRAVA